VDTHPIHFHLYDVQLINRVTWDNIIIPTEPGELGWKDTVRVSPLEDTIVALRPILPKLPFEIPNSVRMLNPMMPAGDTSMFNSVDPNGNPAAAITNRLVNFGWEYLYHCHILSHEEMDMMRPVSVAVAPNKPGTLDWSVPASGTKRRVTITWKDNSINETAFVVQKSANGGAWTDVGTDGSPIGQPNTHGSRSLTDPATYDPNAIEEYRVVAENTVGYGAEFPSVTAKSISAVVAVGELPKAPTALTAVAQSGPKVTVGWTDNAVNEASFALERSTDGGAFVEIAAPQAKPGTGSSMTYVDTDVTPGSTYGYRVAAVNLVGRSANSNIDTAVVPAVTLTAPTIGSATAARQSQSERVTVTWSAAPTATGYLIEWSASAGFTTVTGSGTVGNTTTFTTGPIGRQVWYVRVTATKTGAVSPPSAPRSVPAA
jgi:hypothetical protein